MSESASPVLWLPDGSQYNPRFNDRYRREGDDGPGSIWQAGHGYLAGCGLREAWRNADRWSMLETGVCRGPNAR